jgi:hypothetical protein
VKPGDFPKLKEFLDDVGATAAADARPANSLWNATISGQRRYYTSLSQWAKDAETVRQIIGAVDVQATDLILKATQASSGTGQGRVAAGDYSHSGDWDFHNIDPAEIKQVGGFQVVNLPGENGGTKPVALVIASRVRQLINVAKRERGIKVVVSSSIGGGHTAGSNHYKGLAVDLLVEGNLADDPLRPYTGTMLKYGRASYHPKATLWLQDNCKRFGLQQNATIRQFDPIHFSVSGG